MAFFVPDLNRPTEQKINSVISCGNFCKWAYVLVIYSLLNRPAVLSFHLKGNSDGIDGWDTRLRLEGRNCYDVEARAIK